MKRWTKLIGGISLFLGGIVLGLYVGGWLLFVGGIVQIVEAVKSVEIQSMGIAIGIVKIIAAGPLGGLCAVFPMTFGSEMIDDA